MLTDSGTLSSTSGRVSEARDLVLSPSSTGLTGQRVRATMGIARVLKKCQRRQGRRNKEPEGTGIEIALRLLPHFAPVPCFWSLAPSVQKSHVRGCEPESGRHHQQSQHRDRTGVLHVINR